MKSTTTSSTSIVTVGPNAGIWLAGIGWEDMR